MRTTKPIATISFNTPDFLKLKLNELLKAGRLSFWAFIVHKPEDDEGGKKEHCHVYVEPSKMLQTDELKAELKEYDPEHPDKPRGCISFNSSKFDPWYLYALHDKRYLASKNQSRRFHYVHDDIVTSDEDDLTFKARSIDMVSLSPYADMEDAQKQGFTWAEYFARGTVPLPQVALFERAWNLLLQLRTDRADREGHPMDIDPETGEVIETPTESSKKRPYIDLRKTDDALRIEVVRDACNACSGVRDACNACSGDNASRPSYNEVHPQAEYVELDPDKELPF